MPRTATTRTALAALIATVALAGAARPAAAQRAGGDAGSAAAEAARVEFKASGMVKRGIELIETGQEERGLKLLSSVPQNYPKAKARFQAWLYLGKHYVKKNQWPQAIKVLTQVEDSEDRDQQAEALYQLGICHYKMDQFNKAFMAFRKVTSEYPFSVFANEAYYYIGQCHFKLDRWSKALEALEMVGTSVPPNMDVQTKAEAGQRLYVKVFDKDFVILSAKGQPIEVELRAKTGDVEPIRLEPLGRSGEHFIGSIRTEPGKPKKDDGTMQFQADDVISVVYVDHNTRSGAVDQRVLSESKLVSTATVGFTNGAYSEYTKGVFGDRDCFIRVKDLDRDVSDKPDRVRIRLRTEQKVKRHVEAGEEDTNLEAPEEEIILHDEMEFELVETGSHTGIFVGSLVPRLIDEAQVETIDTADGTLHAVQGDDIVLTYMDELHMQGEEPRKMESRAKLLVGQIQDVRIVHRVPDTVRDKARKNLLEGRIYLKLGQIFKDVGLKDKAAEKADIGLSRIADVLDMRDKAALDREIVEETYSVKWELLLVQGKLGQAIAVCRELMTLFPDSSLVDSALFNIAMARKEAEDYTEAVRIFSEITRLKDSPLAAEAQFRIAEITELQIVEDPRKGADGPKALAPAMLAYQKCAERYPDSPYAGEALEKIAQYYIDTKDYGRAVELMERVFQDYQDADFLPKMLVKWIIVAMRMNDKDMARAKAEKLMNDYPKMATKAKEFIAFIDQM